MVNARSLSKKRGWSVEVCICESGEGISVCCGDICISGTVVCGVPVLAKIGESCCDPITLDKVVVVTSKLSVSALVERVPQILAVSLLYNTYYLTFMLYI